jgi:hypothetical protein
MPDIYEVKFFFYGVLVDFEPPEGSGVEVVERIAGTTLGRLYDLGPFPGSKFGGNDEVVTGKVVIFHAPHKHLIQSLIQYFDHIEGYTGNDEESFYVRKNVDVITTQGFHKCQAYEFNTPTEELMKQGFYVPGGDWHKFKYKMKEGTAEEIKELTKAQSSDEEDIS